MSDRPPGIETRRMRAALEHRLFALESEPVRIGRFVIIDRLGSGGMGTVYRAYDPDLDRRVAVKVLRAEAEAGSGGEIATARLLREAKTMARLNHPNVVTVHEVGIHDGRVYLAMEYVDAGSMVDWMTRRGAATAARVDEAIDLAIQAARGLVAAHHAGVVHRDLKPANILVDAEGRLRIADFGLASSTGGATPGRDAPPGGDARSDVGGAAQDDDLTATGDVVGTPAYMAPEQVAGEADARSDQFSYCASFFEAVYGVAPYGGRTIAERLASIATGEIVTPSGAVAPQWLRALLVRGLADKPEDRHPDMAALLEQLLAHRRGRGRGRRAVYAVTAAGFVAAAIALALPRGAEVRCGDGGTRLGDAWSPSRRDAVVAAIEESGLPYATTAAARVLELVDVYARDWSTAYEDACTATWERGEQSADLLDLRMVCLERSKAALGFVTETLAAGDAGAVRVSVDLVHKLPELAPCSDRDALQRRRDRGRSAEQHAAAEATIIALDRVGTLMDLGRLDDADAMLVELAAQAEQHQLRDVVARVAAQQAQVLLMRGHFDAAATKSDEALRAAEASIDGDVAAIAHMIRARVEFHGAKLDAAAHQLDLADAALLRGDSVPVREAEIALIRGELLGQRNDFDAALASLDRAQAILVETQGATGSRLANVLSVKATVMGFSGRQDEALALHLESADMTARVYGPSHPGQAFALYGAAYVHQLRGETAKALEMHLRAHALLESDPTYKPQQRLRIILAIADECGQLARHDEALAWLGRAETLAQQVYPPNHPETVLVDFSRGSILLDTEKFEAAAATFESVLARWQGVDARAYDSAIARLNLAVALARAGHHDRALDAVATARSQLEGLLDPQGQQMIGYLASFGEVYRLAGRTQDAVDAYEQALRISAAHDGGGFMIDDVRFALARILLARGDRPRAAALAKATRDSLTAAGAAKADVLAELDAWQRAHGLAASAN